MKNSEITIFVVEDDASIRFGLEEVLRSEGFDVASCDDGGEAIQGISEALPDLIVLDVMLPNRSGYEIATELRKRGCRVPILMLTAKGDPMDRVVGLELGADDYLPKPFEPRELLARLRAILRRGQGDAPSSDVLRFGRLEIDRGSMTVRIDDRVCELTAHQFKLLEIMALAAGRVLTREYLMDQLTGTQLEAFDRSIDVHISRIRTEIEDDPKHPKRVITVRGAGYVFAASQD